MSPRHTPTVRQLPPIRRLVAGALIAGTAAVAIPATANAAASTCSYNTGNKNLIVDDQTGGGPTQLRIVRTGEQIRIADGNGSPRFCPIPGPLAVATVTNTDRIVIFRNGVNIGGGVHIDMSGGGFAPGATPEADGNSEIEIAISDAGSPEPTHNNAFRVTGSPQNDVVMANLNGEVNFGADGDVDVTVNRMPDTVTVRGGDGADILRGAGVRNSQLNPLSLFGEAGNDTVAGGQEFDNLFGGTGGDRLYSVDGAGDFVHGDDVLVQDGPDTAITDPNEVAHEVELHLTSTGGLGHLKLAPAVLQAKAGRVAHTQVSWEHPKAWKALRTIDWRVFAGTKVVGKVTVRPAGGRVVAHGAVTLAGGSRVSHKGTTVTAKVAVRLSDKLAGQTLRVEVQATDAKGHRQIEPGAGLIRVAR
jgi:Ca2+-binding RTX toxin-like protein